MLRSMYAGVAGLRVHQTKMDVIGNNIANVNTAGFKASTVTFKEMLSQTLRAASEPGNGRGGLNPMQVGLGVVLGSIDTDLSQGNLQATGKMTDIAIQGNGLFVINNGTQNVFTRAGVFTFDQNGNLVHRTTGYKVMGWMADADGNLKDMNPSTMQPLSLGEQTMSPTATSYIKYKGNLDTKKSKADLTYGPSKVTISDTNGLNAELYITSQKIAGTATADRGDDRWQWTACTDTRVRGQDVSVAAFDTPINLDLSAATNFKGINAGTIVLSDGAGKTFVEGQDYTVDLVAGTVTLKAPSGITPPATLKIDFDMRDQIAQGEVAVDETGSIKTSSVDKFNLNLSDSLATKSNTVEVKAPVIGEANGGFFGVTTAGANAKNIDGTYGPAVTTSWSVYDSKGVQYTMNVSLVKTEDNRWDWYAQDLKDPSGNTLKLANNFGTIYFDPRGKVMGTPTGGPLTFQPSGSEKVSIAPDWSAVTQFDDKDSLAAYTSDGYEAGSLESFAIDTNGNVIGSYSNGLNKTVAKMALATFTNPAGLMKSGETVFTESNNSGKAEYGIAGVGGRGSFSAGNLEMSNVDLADQFTEMITTQRGFQAASKIIQTADQVLQDLVNLKR